MQSSKLKNLNDYTLLKESPSPKIYFYPSYSVANIKITTLKDEPCLVFDITSKGDNIYQMVTTLVNSDFDPVYTLYSLYLEEISLYNYYLLSDLDTQDRSLTINFNTLNFDELKKLMTHNLEFQKLAPYLVKELKKEQKNLEEEKQEAENIDIPSRDNYYQNVVGFTVNELLKLATPADDQTSKKIAHRLKKNFDIVVYNEFQNKLALLILKAYLVNRVKSSKSQPRSILETTDLKPDTNKSTMAITDLNSILNSFIKKLRNKNPEEIEKNIIQERIEYILSLKPRLKEITNYMKIIIASDNYLEKNTRIRKCNELIVKDTILNCLSQNNIHPLPRNEVLIYNIRNEIIDFLVILSIDKLQAIISTYKMNCITENSALINYIKNIDKILANNKITTPNYLAISLFNLLLLNDFNNQTPNSNCLWFNKGKFILKLDYIKGNYDIKVINTTTNKEIGKLLKLTPETQSNIQASLDKGEKNFNKYINNLIYKSLKESIVTNNIEIKYREDAPLLSRLIFKRKGACDVFDCSLTYLNFLEIISEIKPSKMKQLKKENSPKTTKSESLVNKDNIDYILRKANVIYNIMKKEKLDNPEYKEVSKLYSRYQKNHQPEVLEEIAKIIN